MNFSKTPYFLLIVLTIAFFLSPSVMAQLQQPAKEMSTTCEEIGGLLDGAGAKFIDLQDQKGKLIIIAGSRSLSYRSFDLKRVKQVMQHLAKFHAIKNDQIEYGIGVLSSSLSYVRIYVAGELIAEIKTRPRSNLCRGIGDPL